VRPDDTTNEHEGGQAPSRLSADVRISGRDGFPSMSPEEHEIRPRDQKVGGNEAKVRGGCVSERESGCAFDHSNSCDTEIG
jgi:hypothetical protein